VSLVVAPTLLLEAVVVLVELLETTTVAKEETVVKATKPLPLRLPHQLMDSLLPKSNLSLLTNKRSSSESFVRTHCCPTTFARW